MYCSMESLYAELFMGVYDVDGCLWGAFHGTMNQVTQGALSAAEEAVKLCITMLGIMSLWTGILEIGQRAGLVEQLAKDVADPALFISKYSRGPSGQIVDCDEYDR